VPPVIAQQLVGTARIPGHDGELRCYRHDRDFIIRVDGIELMSTRVHGSEELLAELALQRLGPRAGPRVLVGGLGMGFTLARTLDLVDAGAVVEVAELVPEVVTWNRELLGDFTSHPLRDPRTRVVVGDVGEVLAAGRGLYDVVLLDVDNGPASLSRPSNDRLYGENGLAVARAALRPGGVLAVWSSGADSEFTVRMHRAGFHVAVHRVRARRTRGPRRTIWVGTVRQSAAERPQA
jgi:spermidine synthase